MTSSLLDWSGETGFTIEGLAKRPSQILAARRFMDYIRRREPGRPGEHGVVGIAGCKEHVDVRTQFARALGQRRPEHATRHHHKGKQQIDSLRSRKDSHYRCTIGRREHAISELS